MQIASTYLLVEPKYVSFNNETEETNFFSSKELVRDQHNILNKVLLEVRSFENKLSELGVEHITVEADSLRKTSSSFLLNDWISTHENGQVVVYPLLSNDRQKDRNENILEAIEDNGFTIKDVVDFTDAETESVFIEGAASVVLDRTNEVAYASLSKHTDEELFIEFCEDMEFTPIVFSSFDKTESAIFHTDLMMSIGDSYALIASSLIKDKKERKLVLNQLKGSGKEVVFISEEQVFQFLGNSIQIKNKVGDKFILMSNTAFRSLTDDQKMKLEKHGEIVSVKLDTIENISGGSVRNLMLEIFLERK